MKRSLHLSPPAIIAASPVAGLRTDIVLSRMIAPLPGEPPAWGDRPAPSATIRSGPMHAWRHPSAALRCNRARHGSAVATVPAVVPRISRSVTRWSPEAHAAMTPPQAECDRMRRKDSDHRKKGYRPAVGAWRWSMPETAEPASGFRNGGCGLRGHLSRLSQRCTRIGNIIRSLGVRSTTKYVPLLNPPTFSPDT